MVTVQRFTSTPNGFGGSTQKWANHIENYGFAFDQLSGNEFVQADKTFPGSTHVLMGEVADIKESDRVLFSGKVYDIKNVDNPMNLDSHLEILLSYKGASE